MHRYRYHWVQVTLRGWCAAGMWRQSIQLLCGALHPPRSVQMLGVFHGGGTFDQSCGCCVPSGCAQVGRNGNGDIPFPDPRGLCFWDESGAPPAPPVGAFLLRNALKLLLDLKRLVLAEGLTDWLLKWCVSILLLAMPKLGLAPDCNLYCHWVFYCWGYVFLSCPFKTWIFFSTFKLQVHLPSRFEKEKHKQIRNPNEPNKTPKNVAPTSPVQGALQP